MITATRSLRFRLLAGALVWTACALALAGIILADLFREHVRRALEAELVIHLNQLTATLEAPDGQPRLAHELSDPRFQRPLSGLYWQVEVPDDGMLRSRSLWDQVLGLPPDMVADGEVHRHEVPAAMVQVEVGLRPLARLRQELAAVRSGLRKRFATSVPVEVEPLTEDLNLLLEHSEAVLARARVQAGNMAHALKADLAVLTNEVRELTPANVAQTAPGLEGRLERMRRHLDHHMARARAAAARGVPGVGTEIGPVASGLARTLERLHAERGIRIELDLQPGLRFGGEQEDLQEMLGNLMDNACKWARRRARVAGRAEGRNAVVLAVEDDGLGMPDQSYAVPSPGVRLDESVPGTGLGLAIVRDLAELYGGVLRLGKAELGGLCAELRLPPARG